MAQASEVEVVGVTAGSPIKKQSEGVSYSILLLNVTVQGSQEDILTFSSNLAKGYGSLQGLQVQSIDIGPSQSPAVPYAASLHLIFPTQPNFVQ